MNILDHLKVLAVSIIPIAILLFVIYRADRVESEPPKLLAKLFFIGVLSTVVALIVFLILSIVIAGILVSTGKTEGAYLDLISLVLHSFVEIAIILLFLKFTTWKSKDFNYRFDAIVYAAYITMGYAFVNTVIVLLQTDFFIFSDVLSGVVILPLYVCFGIFMGFFYGKAKELSVKGKSAKGNLFLALLVPSILNSFFSCIGLLKNITLTIYITLAVIFFLASFGLMLMMSKSDYRIVEEQSLTDWDAPYEEVTKAEEIEQASEVQDNADSEQ